MKHFFYWAILLGSFLFSLPVYSVVYMEYSQAMVDAFTDSKNQSFIKHITRGEPITFYAVHPEKGTGYRQQFGEKPFEKLKECFSQDRLNDTCDENDNLQRHPDSSIDFTFLDKLKISSINVGVLFASYTGKMRQFKQFLQKKNRPFHLLYHVSKKKKLFYLSFGQIKNGKLLVGIHPFQRQDQTTQCSATCIKKRVKFLDNCFSGRLPGYLQRVDYRYPDKPLLPNKYIRCPAGSFPPKPVLPRHLTTLETGVSERGYYRDLKTCWNQSGIPLPNEIPTNVGIKMEIDLTVLPANPKQFNKLPKAVKKMLASFAKVSVGTYTQSIMRTVRVEFLNCQ